MNQVANVAAYKFTDLGQLSDRRKHLRKFCKELKLKGTILLSPEGINLFVAGARPAVNQLIDELRREPQLSDLETKLSYSDHVPFRRMLVKIKPEIITLREEGIRPVERTVPKLSARQLKTWLDAGKPVTLLDVRNDYEVKLGAFENALPIGISNFRQFPEKIRELPEELRHQPIVMYCTGGIRCEKAGPVMEEQGFEKVFQLNGGILKYFEECGGEHFGGECFVFDQRVAVDHDLKETDATMCYVCQATLTPEEQQNPEYVIGQSCPHCYRSPSQSMQDSIDRRHKKLHNLISPLPGCIPYDNRRPMHVTRTFDGRTLWEMLTQMHPHVAVEDWQAAIQRGHIQRDHQSLQASDVLRAGERIEHLIPATVEPMVNADIQILYEDPMIVVVRKPAPLPMHPSGRFNRNTLIEILNQTFAPERLRVAHRLDANTTGIVILSRTRQIAGILQPQFERGEVEKTYLAKVVGHPKEDRFACDAPIGPTALGAGRREIAEDGLSSLTEFEVVKRYEDKTTLLKVWPRTGRTNQIRIHLAHLGLPICGDPTYGLPASESPHQTLSVDSPPLCLHAWRIRFRHPADGKPIHFEAASPFD